MSRIAAASRVCYGCLFDVGRAGMVSLPRVTPRNLSTSYRYMTRPHCRPGNRLESHPLIGGGAFLRSLHEWRYCEIGCRVGARWRVDQFSEFVNFPLLAHTKTICYVWITRCSAEENGHGIPVIENAKARRLARTALAYCDKTVEAIEQLSRILRAAALECEAPALEFRPLHSSVR